MGYTKEERNIWQKSFYNKRKQRAIDFLGGKCAKCGSLEFLEFDHKNPKTKKINITSLLISSSWKVLLIELEKCQLLCHECHWQKTLEEQGWKNGKKEHGTVSSYKYCHCQICTKHNREYNRKYREKYQKTHKKITINGKRIIVKIGEMPEWPKGLVY